MKKEVFNIGLLGLGTIGTGVWKLITENHDLIEDRIGCPIHIKKVVDKDLKRKREIKVPKEILSDRAEDILDDPEIDLVVELIGGVTPAGDFQLRAIQNGKHLVTANKALLAERGAEIFAAARENGVSVGFEASVAGGIPILKAIREGFIANRIQQIVGIINGTANFILSKMTAEGKDFQKVLRQAQEKGYAEADPTFDVEGIDSAQKLALLISLCYGVRPPIKGVYTEGISKITPVDIEFAKRFGFTIKLLAIAEDRSAGIEARVHPTMIPIHHPLADIGGAFNAIFLKGDAVGETLFMGQGAGMMPTASAVVSDIAMIASGFREVPLNLQEEATLQPIGDLETEYYLRFSVVDKPGVLAKISQHLGENEISISNVYQENQDVGSKVPIVVMTHRSKEANMQKAINKIDELDVVLDKTMLIRLHSFE